MVKIRLSISRPFVRLSFFNYYSVSSNQASTKQKNIKKPIYGLFKIGVIYVKLTSKGRPFGIILSACFFTHHYHHLIPRMMSYGAGGLPGRSFYLHVNQDSCIFCGIRASSIYQKKPGLRIKTHDCRGLYTADLNFTPVICWINEIPRPIVMPFFLTDLILYPFFE